MNTLVRFMIIMHSTLQTKLSLPLLHRGKVRDIFDIDKDNMLIVTTDRLSAFDVVFDQPIPEKGKILTSIANYWFDKTEHIIQNHLTNIGLDEVLPGNEAEALEGRAIVVKKLKPLPIEAVVRGYLIGSGNNLGAVLGGFVIWFFWVQVEPIGQLLMTVLTLGLDDSSALKIHLLGSVAHMRLLTMGLILLLVLRFSPRGLLPEK